MSTKVKGLTGQTAFVSHSTRGPGRRVAEIWGQEGAKVALHYRYERAGAEESVKRFKAEGGKGLLVRADLSDENQLEMLAENLRRELGGLDLLCLNLAMREETEKTNEWAESLRLACKHLLPLGKGGSQPKVLLLLPETDEGPWTDRLSQEAVSMVKSAGSHATCHHLRRESDGTWSPQSLAILASRL